MSAVALRICSRCRRELLPRLAAPMWRRDVHRAPGKNMVEAPDPRAETIRRRKAEKALTLRQRTRRDGFIGAAKFFLAGRASEPVDRSEECEACQALNRRTPFPSLEPSHA